MPSSSSRRPTRRLNIAQFVAVMLAVAIIGSLLGGLAAGLMVPAVGAVGATVRALPETFRDLPSDLQVVRPSEGSRMLDADGRVLAHFYEERRTIVTSEQIAPIMKQAIVAIEDRRFFSHHGVDPDGMLRALVANVTSGGTQGASTITQQYVKNILMQQGIQAGDQQLIDEAQEVSAERKLREARYALALETQMSKDEILTGYLNLATFGTNIYGVEAAARAYFSKSAADLTIAEAALLAGTVQSPIQFDPLVNPEQSQQRRNDVLQAMLRDGYIDGPEYRKARDTPVEDMMKPDNRVSGCMGAGKSAYFCNYALQEFLSDEDFGTDRAARLNLLNTGGLTLRTTLQRPRQEDAYQAAVDRVGVDDPSGVNTAIVSLVPENGYIVAMAQNTKYGVPTKKSPNKTEVSFNADAEHNGGDGFPPGSTFKMFTLVQWFKEERSAWDVVGSTDRWYRNGSFRCGGLPIPTEDWEVTDLPGKDGPTDVIRAAALSINQAFVNMASQVDLCQIFETAADMGVTAPDGTPIPEYPPNIIGSDAVTPLMMANAYATVANDGVNCSPMALTEVEDRTGTVEKAYEPKCKKVIEPKVAKQVANVLRMTATTYPYQIDRPFAAKSGTTDNNANTWMVGFVPQLATAAWAGFAQSSSKPVQDVVINGEYYPNVYGGTFIGPMWTQYMRAALTDTPVEYIEDVWLGNRPPPPEPPADEKSKDEKPDDEKPDADGQQPAGNQPPANGRDGR